MTLPLRWLAALLMIWLLGLSGLALAAERAGDPLPRERIEQLVAPIALYPDALLTQILMAATYPLDVVQADRWLQDHRDLQGEALDQAVRGEPWDDSVKVLVQFPAVLGFMSAHLDWTQDLGDAVLGQLPDLTDAIQRLRREAEMAGNLQSNDRLRVEKAGETIVIQPAAADTVYVPTYDPTKVYGQTSPPASYYPAVYADAATQYTATQPGTAVVYPATQPTTVYSTTSGNEGLIGFGAGALVGGLLTAAILWDDHDDHIYWGGPGYWGGRSYWSQPAYWNNQGWRSPTNINIDRNIDIDRTRIRTGDIDINQANINRANVGNQVTRWEHNPARRGGVAYRDRTTAAHFAGRQPEGAISRDEARGRLQGADPSRLSRDTGHGRAEGVAGGKLTAPRQPSAVAEPPGRPGRGEGQVRKAPEGTKPRETGAKAGGKAGRAAVERPKVDAAKAQRRPVEASAQRPAQSGAKAQLPARTEGGAARAARPESASRAAGQGAFKVDKPRVERAASNRGAVSRGGGGGGRAAAGGGRHGGAGGRGR